MHQGIFTGYLGADGEKRSTPSGETVVNFRLAVDVGNKANPKTLWVSCSVWGKRADSLEQYLTKGMKVTVIGRIGLDEYQKSDGSYGSNISLSVQEIDLTFPRKDGDEQPAQSSHHQAKSNGYAPKDAPYDDDLPF